MTRKEPTTPSIKTLLHRGIEDFLKWAYTFFFLSIKLKLFRITQNDTPKMVKKFASTNRLSHFFAERFYWSLFIFFVLLFGLRILNKFHYLLIPRFFLLVVYLLNVYTIVMISYPKIKSDPISDSAANKRLLFIM